ncbi:MAG: hypothetical protein GXO57_00005, partial [Thermodesulfobacteria bacterium]|nr:hypothetical protein [Thermodesulfobacteriota bacterium]
MWKTLSILEFKSCWKYYLLSLVFLFFWSFFSVVLILSIDTSKSLKGILENNLKLYLVTYAKDSKEVKNFSLRILSLDGVKKVKVITPKELFKDIK